MSDINDMELVLGFDTDDPQYARGFEAGMLWERMNAEHHLVADIHATNTEMVMRMAEAKGFSFVAEDLNDDWTHVELHR